MKKRKKWIILILIIIIIVPIAYFGITILEEQIFYNSIKEISDIENKTDATGDVIRNNVSPSNEDYKSFCEEAINTSSTEIVMLQELKGKLFTESYKEFVDIQINRLNSENRTYTAMLNWSNIYEEYKEGSLGYNRALSIMEDKNNEIESYANKTGEYKIDADSFLSLHTDMKDKFNELGIDEDFLYNQIEDVKTEYVK